jgi:gas vesicle protein
MFFAAISDSVERGFDEFFAFLPRLIGFVLILVIGYFIAKVVKGIVAKVLEKVGVDRALHSGTLGRYVDKMDGNLKPSQIIGAIAFWFLFLGVIGIAVSTLGINALENLVASITAYLPNVIAALLILIVAGAVSAAVTALIASTMGDTTTGKIVGAVVPVLIMAIAGFMVLNQLKIAPEIVTITYAALIGSAALAMALAFGLGGRDVARQLLSEAYDSGKENKQQVKDDLDKGKEEAKDKAQQAKAKAEDKAGNGRFDRSGETETQTLPVGSMTTPSSATVRPGGPQTGVGRDTDLGPGSPGSRAR